MYNQYNIYCPGSHLTIGNVTDVCPDKPFVLPLTTTFSINKHEFVGNELYVNHLESTHPAWAVRANWVLKPDDSLKKILKNLKDDLPLVPIEITIYHRISFSIYVVGAVIILILLISVCYCGYRSCKTPEIEIIARARNEDVVKKPCTQGKGACQLARLFVHLLIVFI